MEDPDRTGPYPDDSCPSEYVGTGWDGAIATGEPVLTPELAAVREEAYQTTFKALTSTNGRKAIERKSTEPVRIATFEV